MPRKYYTLIYEDTELVPIQNVDVTYRIGPYDSREEADDAYFVACYHVKPETDEIGRPLYWDYDVEEEGEEDVGCSC